MTGRAVLNELRQANMIIKKKKKEEKNTSSS